MGNSMSSMVLSGDTSGTVTVTVPAVAGTNTATLPAATGTVMVSGNMPAFSYYQSVQQTIASSATFTKITFTSNDFDVSSGMFASSRFTPTIAGYYQISAGVNINSATWLAVNIYKNGSTFKNIFNSYNTTMNGGFGSALVYCNGSTDYVEIYASVGTTSVTLTNSSTATYFQGVLVRTS